MYPHSIRLRDPWETETLGPIVRRRRYFHTPTQLCAGEAVWVVVERVQASAEASLNGKSLGKFGPSNEPWAYEVTNLLAARNELVFDLAAGNTICGETPLGNVRLEIRLAPPESRQ